MKGSLGIYLKVTYPLSRFRRTLTSR